VPDGNDPRNAIHGAIEESIWLDDDLAIWEVGKFSNFSTGLREPFETPQDVLSATSEALGGVYVIGTNVADSRQKLRTP